MIDDGGIRRQHLAGTAGAALHVHGLPQSGLPGQSLDCKGVGTDFDAITRSVILNVTIGETEKDVADKLAWTRAHYKPLLPAEEPRGPARAQETNHHPDPADQLAVGGATAAVFGDSADGAVSVLEKLEDAGVEAMTKVQPPVAPGGMLQKEQQLPWHRTQGRTRTRPPRAPRPRRTSRAHARHPSSSASGCTSTGSSCDCHAVASAGGVA